VFNYLLKNKLTAAITPNSMENKKAKTSDDAWKIQETYTGKPHGWIQWKGTNVCMDVYCKCGAHSHIDASFAYYFKCSDCGAVYMCNGHIELIELEVEPDSCVIEPD
jgi:hypothetical protein